MKRLAAIVLAAVAIPGTVKAAATSGHAALALATLVAIQDPTLPNPVPRQLGTLLDDRALPKGSALITVQAKSVTCGAGDVDIAAFHCDLAFRTGTRHLTGRPANELYATLIEAGVPSDGAAGTIYEAVQNLVCRIDPDAIASRGGSGADCSDTPGP